MQILLEHNLTPGTVYDESLIFGTEGCMLNEMVNLNEASDPTVKALKFKGKLQEAEAVNKNKRFYPYSVLDANMNRLEESLKAGGLCGELDHPTDSIVHFANASHKLVRMWWEKNVLMGEGYILSTPSGKVLRALINDGVRIGMSSRGVGSGKVNENGVLVIGESYKLITFDAVADPSTYAAFHEKYSSKGECFTPSTNIMQNTVKNEVSSIHTINKDMLLAYLGGIVNQKTQEIKARLE